MLVMNEQYISLAETADATNLRASCCQRKQF